MKLLLLSMLWLSDKVTRLGVAISVIGVTVSIICATKLEKQ
jgi:hypothetical protein